MLSWANRGTFWLHACLSSISASLELVTSGSTKMYYRNDSLELHHESVDRRDSFTWWTCLPGGDMFDNATLMFELHAACLNFIRGLFQLKFDTIWLQACLSSILSLRTNTIRIDIRSVMISCLVLMSNTQSPWRSRKTLKRCSLNCETFTQSSSNLLSILHAVGASCPILITS